MNDPMHTAMQLKLERAEALKSEGNALFGSGKLGEALVSKLPWQTLFVLAVRFVPIYVTGGVTLGSSGRAKGLEDFILDMPPPPSPRSWS